MPIVKRFLIYIIAGVFIVLAVVFHFVLTKGISAQFESKLKLLQTLRDNLKAYASGPKVVRNDASIAAAQKRSQQMTEQINQSEQYLALQPRAAHTRRFFENEKLGTGKEIRENVIWRRVYEEHVEQLRRQLEEAGLTAFNIQISNSWGAGVPSDAEIAAAMELFWRQKDLADFFTDQVEKDLTEFMAATTAPGAFPAKPSDLVISRNYARLDELLRGEEKEGLTKVFQAIIFNEKQQDLSSIFDENLPSFPWAQVLTITLDDAQRRYLDDLVPAGKEDLANRQRFKDFVMELRLVRYRSDVIGLLDSRPGFDNVASMLRKGTEEERARIMEEMTNQGTVWLAQAIAGIVCLRNEKDYNLVRNNHAPQVAQLASLTMSAGNVSATSVGYGEMDGGMGGRVGGMGMPAGAGRPPMPSGMPGGGRSEGPGDAQFSATPESELYQTFPFSMRVKIEFDHIPVFLRRLLNSSWRYRVRIIKVLPTTAGAETGEGMGLGMGMGEGRTPGMAMPVAPRGGAAGPGFGPGFGPGMTTPTTPPLSGMPGAASTETIEPVEVRNYIWLDISGDAHQFSPIRQKLESEAAKAAEAAKSAAGGTAP